jgi:hypothetical protein
MLEQSRLEELDLDAKDTETNSDSHSDNSNKIESYSHLLYLLSHTTVQSTATSEIELRGDITQFRFFLAISSLMTSISEVAVLYLTFQGFRLFFKKLDRSVYAGTSSLERCDHVAPQWSYSFTKGYFFQKKITHSASLAPPSDENEVTI